MRIATELTALVLGACIGGAAFAQGYPTKPVRVIVPFTTGSGVDVVARMVAGLA